ncbi:MAG: g5 orf [Microgenomates group bacterium GW2011_GWA2_40_6]|nr:MAG: g5 orf [Microgenomates group bacterium GW2011_GWA2_40_6]
MEQHPIPQQITSYEFKLVGEMTLKQFGKAAGGIVLALIVNASPLVFFIKWPLMFILAVGGLALAFVPFQDRPLETWLLAFIKSIYNPTIYLYKKKAMKNWLDVDLSRNLAKINEEEEEKEEKRPVKEKTKVKEFIESLPSVEREGKKDNKMNRLEDEKKIDEKISREEDEKKKEEVDDKRVQENTWSGGRPDLKLKREKLGATGSIVFGEIPMPDIPDVPNLIVGMVTDSNKKIVEGAIVEIQDREGNPNRVLKTNSLGQFRTSTQLTDGEYLIVTEKENMAFDRVRLVLSGQIVPPVKIISK